jgi:hypothetical protein
MIEDAAISEYFLPLQYIDIKSLQLLYKDCYFIQHQLILLLRIYLYRNFRSITCGNGSAYNRIVTIVNTIIDTIHPA